MSIKLIREAQLQTTLPKEDLDALNIIKKAVGAASIAEIIKESFVPTADDYDTWLRVVVGTAQDEDLDISKRGDFMKLAMYMLEHDPANPPFEMHDIIAKKLWQDYQAAKHEVRVNKIAAAKEEEEKVAAVQKQIASRFARGPSPVYNPTNNEEEELGLSDEVAAQKIFNKIKGTPNLNFAVVQQYVNRYLGMVGKAPTDAKYISALVFGKLQDAGMASEDEESGFAQAFNAAKGSEEEESSDSAYQEGYRGYHTGRGNPYAPGTKQYIDWNTGRDDAQYERHGHEEDEEEGEGDWYDRSGRPDPHGAYDAGGHFHRERDGAYEDEAVSHIETKVRVKSGPYRGRLGTIRYDAGGNKWVIVSDGGADRATQAPYDVVGGGFEDEEDDHMSFVRDALSSDGDTKIGGSLGRFIRGEDDAEDDADSSFDTDYYSVDDDEVFTSDDATDGDDHGCKCDHHDDAEDEVGDADGEVDVSVDTPERKLDDEPMDDEDAAVKHDKAYDEEEAVKTFFRQAVTSPRDMINQAVKDIEAEGKDAWKKANVPANPHPKKSQAHRAWQKGMLAAAKEALGIEDKPKTPDKKPKRKK